MKRMLMTVLASLMPGLAAAAPVILPTRDVSVQYSLAVPGQAVQTVQLFYNAALESARVVSENGYYVLANLPTGKAQLVVPALHAIVQAPNFSLLTGELFLAENAHFTRLGQGHYAGLACETYRIVDQNGTAQACLTADGVVLHFSGHDEHGGASLTALRVAYGQQPASQFQPPPGFNDINLPPGAVQALLMPQN